MAAARYCDLLRTGAETLTAAGISEARSDARWLLLRASDLSATDLIMVDQDEVSGIIETRFEAMIARRVAREPVSLILGDVEFMGLTLKTDQRALAPRQDSERLVELALAASDDKPEGLVVDLGTGSGCLILSFLAHRPGWRGVGLDLSSDALALAEENANATGLSERVSWLSGSWEIARGALSDADLVMSNPPYIATDVVAGLEPEVLNHDPMLALDGGADGLTAYRDILQHCFACMRRGKPVLFEIGYDQGETVSELLSGQGFAEIEVFRDFSGQNRVIKAVQP